MTYEVNGIIYCDVCGKQRSECAALSVNVGICYVYNGAPLPVPCSTCRNPLPNCRQNDDASRSYNVDALHLYGISIKDGNMSFTMEN